MVNEKCQMRNGKSSLKIMPEPELNKINPERVE
jgi:hypothetical protein